MAKQLIIIRHGKAEPEVFPIIDKDRSLIEKGKLQAQFVGTQLRQSNIKIDAFFYSDAQRTTETFEIIEDVTNNQSATSISSAKLYLCSAEDILDFVATEAQDSHNTIVVIGHNNGLSDFYNLLTKLPLYHSLSTCETVVLSLAINSWQDIYNDPKATIKNNIKPQI